MLPLKAKIPSSFQFSIVVLSIETRVWLQHWDRFEVHALRAVVMWLWTHLDKSVRLGEGLRHPTAIPGKARVSFCLAITGSSAARILVCEVVSDDESWFLIYN